MNQQSSTQVFKLDAGTHWICTCGQSKNAPYCDGGHQGTSLKPMALELETPKRVEIAF